MSEVVNDAAAARNQRAREQALEAMAAVQVDPVPMLRYTSEGRVAVIGGMEALEFAPRLHGRLKPLLILTEGIEEPGVPVVPLGGRPIAIEGHLGQFTLKLGTSGKPNFEQIQVDLILDLSPKPLLTQSMPPAGYVWSALDELSLLAATEQLQEMVGTFEKPRFFDYDPTLCAHQRAGKTACTRCIDACPAEAIRSIAEAIEVDANRCQGGGICATVCPAGAIRYRWPKVGTALEQVKRLLTAYREAGGSDPVLLLVTEQQKEVLNALPSNYLPFEVEEPASRGLEFWFGALSYGARQVVVLVPDALSEGVSSALRQQIEMSRQILAVLGYPADALRMVSAEALDDGAGQVMPEIEPASFAPVGEKRQLFFTALDHLYEQASRPRPLATLEVGAPFGTVFVDGERCTLCSACVGACPGKALQTAEDEPGLRFLEANCLQCGMCTRTCPEDAISITPRLLFDREKRHAVRLLHKEEPFHCIRCGKPFATLSVVNRMHRALQGHWMFQSERARQRLKMCDDCRVVDVVQDPMAMELPDGVRLDQ